MAIDNRIRRISDKTARRYVRLLQGLFVLALTVLTVLSVWVQLDLDIPHAREKILGIDLACGFISLGLLVVYAIVSYVDWKRNLVLVPDLPTVDRRGHRRVLVPPRPARYFKLVLIDYCLILGVVIVFVTVDVYLLTALCGWLYSATDIALFLKWTFFSGMVSNQFCHILSLLPKEAIEKAVRVTRTGWYFKWRNIELTDGIDMPSSVYATVFLTFFVTPTLCILLALFAAVGVIGGSFCTIGDGPVCLSGLQIQDCNPWSAGCQVFQDERGYSGRLTFLTIANSLVMFHIVVYVVCLLLLARALHPMPYKRFKMTRVHLGYHIMTRIPISLLLILNFIFLWMVEIGSCPVQFMSNAGFGSLILALSCLMATSLWINTPVAYGTDHEEGEIAFERDINANNEMRISFARMVESFVYSYMVYDVDEPKRQGQMSDLEDFMDEYGLDDYEVFWNKHVDSKCVIAWNSDTGKIVMAFRGTVSSRNVISDLKIWREPHEPERGNYWMGTKPMLHAGFSEFFYRSGIREDCLERIERILNEGHHKSVKHWDILVSGHSLGGAAAQIASYEIAEWLNGKDVAYHLACYTYGCPRVGNSAFAKCYNDMVPDTWNIMHLDDLVTKGGKFLYMFKRGGRPCFLTAGGPIVCPSFMTRVTLRGLKTSVQRHLLPAYATSLVHTVTQHGIVDWDTPDKQRARLAVLNTKVFKYIQKNFTEKRVINLTRKRNIKILEALDDDLDVDLATGMTGIHRLDSTLFRASDPDAPADDVSSAGTPEESNRHQWYLRWKSLLFSWFGGV